MYGRKAQVRFEFTKAQKCRFRVTSDRDRSFFSPGPGGSLIVMPEREGLSNLPIGGVVDQRLVSHHERRGRDNEMWMGPSGVYP